MSLTSGVLLKHRKQALGALRRVTQKRTHRSLPSSSPHERCPRPAPVPPPQGTALSGRVCDSCWGVRALPREPWTAERPWTGSGSGLTHGGGSSPGISSSGRHVPGLRPHRDIARTSRVDAEEAPPGPGTVRRSRMGWPGAVEVGKGQATGLGGRRGTQSGGCREACGPQREQHVHSPASPTGWATLPRTGPSGEEGR